MLRAIGLLILASLVACGGARHQTTDDEEEDTPAVASEPAASADDPGAAASIDAKPPEAVVDDALSKLRNAKPAALAALVDAMDAAAARETLAKLRKDEPAYGWVALRVGRILAHARRYREAEQVLAATVGNGSPSGAAAAIAKDLARLQARSRVQTQRVGVLLPLSGPYAAIGKSALAAVQLAFAGEKGLELVVGDSEGEAERAARAVEKLVLDEGVGAIVGPVGTFESEAAALAAERFEVPIMVLSAGEGVTGTGPFVFRHRATRSDQARAVARFAVEEMGLRRFAILYPESDYGREMMKAFWQTVEKLGGQVNGAEGYSLQFLDFSVPIKKLVGRYHLEARTPDPHWAMLNRKARDRAQHYAPIVDFDAVFIPDGGNRARQALNFLTFWDVELKTSVEVDPYELRKKYGGDVPPLVQVLGGSGFNDPRFVERAGVQAHGSVFVDVGIADSQTAAAFQQAYQEKTGKAPDALAAHAYDAARMVAQAVRGAGDRDAVRRNLEGIRGFDGVLGTSTVRGDRDVQVPLRILTIQPDAGIVPRGEIAVEGGQEDAPVGE